MGAVVALTVALIVADLTRGPFYDEFYSAIVTAHDRPFAQALGESWLKDNHPPLFYILGWLTRFFADSIAHLRLLNPCILVLTATGAAIALRRTPQHWLAASLFAFVIAADLMTISAGSEFRSYFLSLCAASLVILMLANGWQDGVIGDRPRMVIFVAALLAGFNTHIVTSLVLGALIFPFLALALVRREYSLARSIGWPTIGAGLVLVAVSLWQLPNWQANTGRFWIPPDIELAVRSLQYTVQRAAEGNLLAALLGGVGCAMLGLAAWRTKYLSRELEVVVLLAIGIAIAGTMLTLLHAVKPMVTERYLVALIPPAAMLIALGGAAALKARPQWLQTLLIMLSLAVTLLALPGNVATIAAAESWKPSADLVAAVQADCSGTAVHVDPARWNAYVYSSPPADNQRALHGAYAMMAAERGVRMEPASSRRISVDCPTLFWAEHGALRTFDQARILETFRGQGFAVSDVHLYRLDHGWVASDRPLGPEFTAQSKAAP